jgi:type IV pilus assembly protein PilC
MAEELSGSRTTRIIGEPYPTLKVPSKVMVDFVQQCAMRLEAGISLINVIKVLGDTEPNAKLKNFLGRVYRSLQNGTKLVDALAESPTPFSQSQLAMIEAGEVASFLPRVFDRMAKNYESQQAIMRQIRGAATYPLVVFVIAFGLAAFLLIRVVPQFAQVFAEAEIELPAITQLLLSISEFVVGNLLISIGSAVGAGIGLVVLWKFLRALPPFQGFLLVVPALGNFLRASMRCQFFIVLGQLLDAGVPLAKALIIVETLHPFAVYQSTVAGFVRAVDRGITLSASMLDSDIFGPRASQLVETGERSGKLGSILEGAGDRLEADLMFQLKSVTQLFEPICIVLLSAFIGTMVAALFLPIFQLSSSVQ